MYDIRVGITLLNAELVIVTALQQWVHQLLTHMKAVMTGSGILMSFGQLPMDMYPDPKLIDLFLDPGCLPEAETKRKPHR